MSEERPCIQIPGKTGLLDSCHLERSMSEHVGPAYKVTLIVSTRTLGGAFPFWETSSHSISGNSPYDLLEQVQSMMRVEDV